MPDVAPQNAENSMEKLGQRERTVRLSLNESLTPDKNWRPSPSTENQNRNRPATYFFMKMMNSDPELQKNMALIARSKIKKLLPKIKDPNALNHPLFKTLIKPEKDWTQKERTQMEEAGPVWVENLYYLEANIQLTRKEPPFQPGIREVWERVQEKGFQSDTDIQVLGDHYFKKPNGFGVEMYTQMMEDDAANAVPVPVLDAMAKKMMMYGEKAKIEAAAQRKMEQMQDRAGQ